jgi:hypothetical protein
VPASPTFPYITVGDDQVVGDDTECAEISEVFVRIHAWSRAVGYPELKTVVGLVRTRIRETDFDLEGFSVNEVQFQNIQYLQDPDGLTRHAVIDVLFIITHG